VRNFLIILIFFLICPNCFANENNNLTRKYIINDMQSNILITMDVLKAIRSDKVHRAIDILEINIDLYICNLWDLANKSPDEKKKSVIETLKIIKEYRQSYPRDKVNFGKDTVSGHFTETTQRAMEILSELELEGQMQMGSDQGN
jgi:hypothetical protein